MAKRLDGSRCRSVQRPHCARWGPCSPCLPKGRSSPTFRLMYYGQTAGWSKMPLGMDV